MVYWMKVLLCYEHKRLWQIFKQRLRRLVEDDVLKSLDLTDYDKWVSCIKRKQTNSVKKGSIEVRNY